MTLLHSSPPRISGLLCAGFMAFGMTRSVAAGVPHLVKDINSTPSQTSYFGASKPVVVNGRVLFTKLDLVHGLEPWVSDGTAAGTRLLKDVYPGSGDSDLLELGFNQGDFYFSARQTDYSRTVWKTDGTPEGTVMVGTVSSGGVSSSTDVVSSGGNLYFIGGPVPYSFGGKALFKTDGVSGISEVNPQQWQYFSRIFSSPGYLQAFGGAVYFIDSSRNLWKTDGTQSGSIQIAALGSDGSSVTSAVTFKGALYFSVTNPLSLAQEIWKSDGTTAGTVLVKTIATSYSTVLDSLTVAGNTLFFRARDTSHGAELWKTDGTSTGTVLVKDIYAGNGDSDLSGFTALGGTLYFKATSHAQGAELWKSNGTAAGTRIVKNLAPGSAGSDPDELTAGDGVLYFTADDGSHGRELWKTDGTPTGTVLVKDIQAGAAGTTIRNLVTTGGTLYFQGQDTVDGIRLWKSNGTAAGTLPVDSASTATDSGVLVQDYESMMAIGGTCFFRGSDGEHIGELWKSDGTAAGTEMVKDIFPGENWGAGALLFVLDGSVYFLGSEQVQTSSFWKSDGTAGGTQPAPEDFFYDWTDVAKLNGVLYYTAVNEANSYDLWRSDGTPEGTYILKTIAPAGSYNFPARHLTVFKGAVYFSAGDGEVGEELWRSDGTEEGTAVFKDLRSGGGSSSPKDFKVVGDSLYFTASGSGVNCQLWKSDGTTTGTVMVKDLGVPQLDFPRCRMHEAGSGLVFGLDHGEVTEYWKSDGTSAGTAMVASLPPERDAYGTVVSERTWVWAGTTAYCLTRDDDHGQELWKCDGTLAGTGMVKDIREGYENSGIGDITVVGGKIYFSADDGVHGRELWKSDGTDAGTAMVVDLTGGDSGGSDPAHLVLAGHQLFFVASANETGRELYVLDVADDLPSPFDQWAAAGGLTGADASADATPQSDGVKNLLKFAFNLNPAAPDQRVLQSADGTAGLPLFQLRDNNPGKVFRVEFLRRMDGNLTYTPQCSSDLQPGSFTDMTGTTTLTPVGANWERVVIEKVVDPSIPRCFGTVRVSQP